MDYEKLKEYGQGIKLTDEAKAEITAKCKDVQSESNEKGGVMLTVAFKRTAAVFVAVAVITAGIACVKYLKQPAPSIDNAEISSTVGNSAENSTAPSPTETATKSVNPETTENDIGGGDIIQDKYRVRYYNITASFVRLVNNEEAVRAWEEKIYEVSPNETNEMIMKRFVQDFNISREDFDKANHELALSFSQEMEEVPTMNPKDYLNQEIYEVYNGDIIYTFDDEIINEYYLSDEYPFCYQDEYENAVIAGTYQTQTTDFYFDYDDHSTVKLRGYEAETTTTIPETIENVTTKPEETETPE